MNLFGIRFPSMSEKVNAFSSDVAAPENRQKWESHTAKRREPCFPSRGFNMKSGLTWH